MEFFTILPIFQQMEETMSADTKITFNNCLTAVREIPFGSATDEAIRWMNKYGVTDLSVLDKSEAGFKMDVSKEAIKQTLVRICVALALPIISTAGAYYNIAAGTTRLLTGCVAHLKKVDEKEIQQEFNAAFTHYLTAVYDLAIGYFFGMRQIGSLLALGAGLLPKFSLPGHAALFAKVEVEADSVKTTNHFELAPCGIKKGADKLTDLLLAKEETKTMTFAQRFSFVVFGKPKAQ
jgi:hypothetical protein